MSKKKWKLSLVNIKKKEVKFDVSYRNIKWFMINVKFYNFFNPMVDFVIQSFDKELSTMTYYY